MKEIAMQLDDILNEFIFECQLRKFSERTIKGLNNNNRRMFRYLKNEFGITKLEKVKRQHIQAYINYLSEQGRKETYINGLIKCYRAFFAYCVDEEYIQESPMKKVKWQKEEMPVIRTFNEDEVLRMVNYYNGRTFLQTRNKLIMTMLLDSGIRNIELCDMKVEDITDNAIKIRGKGKKIRYVPLTPSINKMLIRYNRVRSNYIIDKPRYQTEYLFLSQKGQKLTIEAVERVVRICGDAVKVREEIRCSPHTCRHYYAQTQLKNGCDLFTVSKLLGHSNINITKRYLNSMETDDILEIGAKTSPLTNL